MALSTEEVLAGLAELINDETGIATDTVELDKSFTDDLDIDSISMMTIVVNAEEKFDVKIPDEEVKNLKTVGDAVSFIVKRPGLDRCVERASAWPRSADPVSTAVLTTEDCRMTKKIVVTGIGATSPLGGTARDSWTALLAGESGARTLEHDWVDELRPARHVRRRGEGRAGRGARAPRESSASTRRASSRSSRRREAWADAGAPEVAPERLGVDCVDRHRRPLDPARRVGHPAREGPAPRPADDRADAHAERGRGAAISMDLHARAVRPHRRLGVRVEHRGDRQRLRPPAARARRRRHRRRLRGCHPPAARSPRSRRCRRCPSRNDDPATASRPYDVDRDGFVLGEGAAAIVARDRGARPGPRRHASTPSSPAARSRATRTTSRLPTPRVRRRARHDRGARAGRREPRPTSRHINAHATSTPVGDIAEYNALRRVFGDRLDEHPGVGDEGVDRSPARRHRRARGDLHGPRAARAHGAADDQPRPSRTPRSRSTS